MMQFIIRFVLTLLLIIGVYRETGIWTAFFCFLVYICFEYLCFEVGIIRTVTKWLVDEQEKKDLVDLAQ